jgi:carboxyl-terminal processing protease
MDDGSAVILSVAKYYSPSGKALQDTGVTPNHPMAESDSPGEDEEPAPPEAPQAPPQPRPEGAKASEDLLLKKAIEVLNAGKAVAENSGAGQKK